MPATQLSEEHVQVNHWLKALGLRTGLSLQLDADGVCAVGHTSRIDCALEVPEGCGIVYLRAPLIRWESGATGLAERCLSEHFLGMRTGGASFAIDRSEGELVLWQSRHLATLEEQSFALLIVDFLEMAAHWKEELEVSRRHEQSLNTTPPERWHLQNFANLA